MTSADVLINTLRQAGMRITAQRVAICNLLAELPNHPTAGLIYTSLKPRFPSLSLMTVYNTLNALVGLGVVRMLGNVGNHNTRFDIDVSTHVNLACVSCGKIVDVSLARQRELEREISQLSGYRLLSARLVYDGICPACQSSNPTHSQ